MKSAILKYVLGVSVSCAFAISYSNPSKAFPVLTDTLAVKSSTPGLITDVRYDDAATSAMGKAFDQACKSLQAFFFF